MWHTTHGSGRRWRGGREAQAGHPCGQRRIYGCRVSAKTITVQDSWRGKSCPKKGVWQLSLPSWVLSRERGTWGACRARNRGGMSMSAREPGERSPPLLLLPRPGSLRHAWAWDHASGCCSQVVPAVLADSGQHPSQHGRPRHGSQRHRVGWSRASGSIEVVEAELCRVSERYPATPCQLCLTSGETEAGSVQGR